MSRGRLLVLALVVLAIVAFFASGAHRSLSFEALKEQLADAQRYSRSHPLPSAAGYFGLYVAVTALSLPGALVMTLAGGALFGLLWGTLLVSFASSIGATLAFLVSRALLRDWVQRRFERYLRPVNEGIEKEGAFYLFSLRLIPQIPFFAINLVMGLMPMRASRFYWVSQLGMLPATVVYVNAGTRLAAIDSPSGILSPALAAALVLLGLLPLASKKLVDAARAKRLYARWPRPASFDRNLVVIGAGAAGLVSAYIAAAVKAKVTLVEKERMGGDCLNTGCVPSKALLRAARLVAGMKNSSRYGIRDVQATVDFGGVMQRVREVIATIEPHDSVERYEAMGVECLRGEARITSPWTVEVRSNGETRTLSTRAIVVAAGARPFVPPIPGIEAIEALTSDNVWDLRELPRRLVVLGGGPIGCELAQAFARLGSQVTQVEMLPRLLPREDPEVSELLAARFREEGIDLRLAHKAKQVLVQDGRKILALEHEGRAAWVEFDALLCAVGRVPNTAGYGLEALGIGPDGAKALPANEYLQVRYPNLYACGDVAGPYQFTHVAAHQAWTATVNALFGFAKKFRVDYSVIPWAVFTDPEVARVGLSETEARERGIACELTTYRLEELDRAIADGAAGGFVRVLTPPGKDRILGATIVGEHAGELIAEFVLAMKHGLGLGKILGTIHVYPTMMEANKYAAGEWKRAHAPLAALKALEKLHAWRRG